MGVYFEKVSKYADSDFPLPTRGTSRSAGYDFYVAEDIVIPPLDYLLDKMRYGVPGDRFEMDDFYGFLDPFSLDEMAEITKATKAKPTLVSTGVKCHLDPDKYLEIMLRSSTPLKYWLIMANSEGIIDADYWNCEANEGEIFLQLINLSPYAIKLKRGDRIAQGIIKSYGVTQDDTADGNRFGGMGSTSDGQNKALC